MFDCSNDSSHRAGSLSTHNIYFVMVCWYYTPVTRVVFYMLKKHFLVDPERSHMLEGLFYLVVVLKM